MWQLPTLERVSVDHAFIYRGGHRTGVDSISRSGIGLGIGIDNQYLLTFCGERSRKVDCSGGFAYATFLVGNGYDFSHIYINICAK